MGAPSNRGRIALIVIAVLAVILVGVGVVVWGAYRSLDANIQTIDPSSGLDDVRPTKADQSINILAIGSDSRTGANGAIGGDSPGLADTTIVVHLSADDSWAAAVSIPRDSMVQMPPCVGPSGQTISGGLRQFNAAYPIGGPACVQRTVESLTGLHIDEFVVVDFQGFQQMVDAVGGVTLDIPTAISDPHSRIYFEPGCQTLDGKQALDYVRVRKGVTGGDGSDLGRIERQQQFLTALVQKVTSAGTLFNPVEMYSFLDAATSSVTTSPGLGSIRSMAGVAVRVREIGLDRIEFTTVPVEAYPPNPNRVQWAEPRSSEMWSLLRADEPLTPPAPSPGPSESGSGGASTPDDDSTPNASPSGTTAPSPRPTFDTSTADGVTCGPQ